MGAIIVPGQKVLGIVIELKDGTHVLKEVLRGSEGECLAKNEQFETGELNIEKVDGSVQSYTALVDATEWDAIKRLRV